MLSSFSHESELNNERSTAKSRTGSPIKEMMLYGVGNNTIPFTITDFIGRTLYMGIHS